MTKASAESAGTLYVVATPIGNLADLGARAATALGQAALVAAEDTRRTGQLLQHLGLRRRQIALHEHNEVDQIATVLAALAAGEDVALVSDAGTPLISDPGFRLVRAAAEAGVAIVGIPGPSAVTAALCVSGIATDRFVFEGFLPRRQSQRRARLEALGTETRTIVLFESVHRIADTVSDLVAVFGPEREAAAARELTKIHEQVFRGTLASLEAALGREIPLLGEFVLVVAGAEPAAAAGDDEVRRIFGLLSAELPPGKAARLCAQISGRSRNEVYALTRES